MQKVLFIEDIDVDRQIVEDLLTQKKDLIADWTYVDSGVINDAEEVSAVVTSFKSLDKEFLSQLPSLQTVVVSSTGYNHVDVDYCQASDISVYNVPEYSTDSVAELGVGLALAWLRDIVAGNTAIKAGEWNDGLRGVELRGKTCGVIGTGAIGHRLAELLNAFGCNVKAFSRSERESFRALGDYGSLDNVLSTCDIVFLAVALTDETRGLIGEKEFALMKENALLVNVARGPVIDSEALHTVLVSGRVGIASDVYDVEPLPQDAISRTVDTAVLTPHVAYKTQEALQRKAVITVENIVNGLAGIDTNRVI